MFLQDGVQMVPAYLQAKLRRWCPGIPGHHVHHVWLQRIL